MKRSENFVEVNYSGHKLSHLPCVQFYFGGVLSKFVSCGIGIVILGKTY